MTINILDSPEEAYKILSPKIYYIGDINLDDSETAEFELFIETKK